MPEAFGASTRVTSGSSSAVGGIAPKAGRSHVVRGSTGASTPRTLAARGLDPPGEVRPKGCGRGPPAHRLGWTRVGDVVLRDGREDHSRGFAGILAFRVGPTPRAAPRHRLLAHRLEPGRPGARRALRR